MRPQRQNCRRLIRTDGIRISPTLRRERVRQVKCFYISRACVSRFQAGVIERVCARARGKIQAFFAVHIRGDSSDRIPFSLATERKRVRVPLVEIVDARKISRGHPVNKQKADLVRKVSPRARRDCFMRSTLSIVLSTIRSID